MILPGGVAGAEGPRYERLIASFDALRAVEGTIRSVRLSIQGTDSLDDVGLELNDGSTQLKQCKADRANVGKWTIPAMADFLKDCRVHLSRRPDLSAVFVSSVPCYDLERMRALALSANGDESAFLDSVVATEIASSNYEELCATWGTQSTSRHDASTALRLLERLHAERTLPLSQLDEELQLRCSRSFLGNRKLVAGALEKFVEASRGRALDATAIKAHMRDLGFEPVQVLGDPTVGQRIDEVRTAFLKRSVRKLIDARLLPRTETDAVVKSLLDGDKRLVLLDGSGGSGKSGVIHEVIERLTAANVPCLPVSLTEYPPRTSPLSFGQALGLKRSPALELAAFSGTRVAVLLIDQMDVLATVTGDSREAWRVTEEMIDEAINTASVKVVVTCRTFDLRNDHALRGWTKAVQKHLSTVTVGLLEEKAVESVAQAIAPGAQLASTQKQLLRNCQRLKLWFDIARSGSPITSFPTATSLMQQHWDWLVRSLAESGFREEEARAAVRAIATRASATGEQILDTESVSVDRKTIEQLVSWGLLEQAGARGVRFAHQSMLDYWMAVLIREKQQSPIEWLGPLDQRLVVRSQLRYFLDLLEDADARQHLHVIEQLLMDSQLSRLVRIYRWIRLAVRQIAHGERPIRPLWRVRWHIVQLVLVHLADSRSPTKEQWDLLCRFAGEDSALWDRVFEYALLQRPRWFTLLLDKGMIAEWVSSPNEDVRRRCWWLIRNASESCGDAVAGLLLPYVKRTDENWVDRILGILPHDPISDTHQLFGLRLRAMRRYDQAWQLVMQTVTYRSKALPGRRAVMLLYVGIMKELARTQAAIARREDVVVGRREWSHGEVRRALRRIGSGTSRFAWERLLPLYLQVKEMRRLVKSTSRLGAGATLEASLESALKTPSADAALKPLEAALRITLEAAAAKIGKTDATFLLDEAARINAAASCGTRRIFVKGLVEAREETADSALAWFADAPRAFCAGGRRYQIEKRLQHSANVLRALGQKCSLRAVRDLERKLLVYHEQIELRDLELAYRGDRVHYLRTYYGLAQCRLLAGLEKGLRGRPFGMGGEAAQRLAEWQWKFRERLAPAMKISGGRVVSPVHKKIDKLSDRAWLSIVKSKPVERRGQWHKLGGGLVGEVGIRQFASDLQAAAERAPLRFARLALKFHSDTAPDYFASVLRALRSASNANDDLHKAVPIETCVGVIARCTPFQDEEQARAICAIVDARKADKWPIDIVDLLERLLREHPDPAVPFVDGEKAGRADRIESIAINHVRPVALEAMHGLLWADPALTERVERAVEVGLADQHPAVRYQAVAGLLPLMFKGGDPKAAVRRFVTWGLSAPESHLAWRPVTQILKYGLREHGAELEPVLQRMYSATESVVVRLGSAWTVAGSVYFGRAEKRARACLQGSIDQRAGAAQAYASMIRDPRHRHAAVKVAEQLWQDPEKQVRSQFSRVFWGKINDANDDDAEGPDSMLAQLEAPHLAFTFARSPSFLDDPTSLVGSLEGYTGPIVPFHEAILYSADRFAEELAKESRDWSTGVAGDAMYLTKLLMRLYEEAARAPEVNRSVLIKCLDAWDALLKNGAGDSQTQLREFDQ